MRPTKVDARRCRCCDQLVSEEDGEALEQHGYDTGFQAWACGECGEVYEDRDEAKACCT